MRAATRGVFFSRSGLDFFVRFSYNMVYIRASMQTANGGNMDKLNKTIKGYFTAALISTCLFVIGIPMIILGATGITPLSWLNKLIMILGIAFTAGDFYATPLLWITYGNARALLVLVSAIERMGISSVDALASHTRLTPEDIRAKLDLCFEKGYLTDFIRDGDTLRRQDPEGELHTMVCPACAARFDFRGEAGKCPWCGTVSFYKGGDEK